MNNFHFHTKVKLKRLKKLDKRNVDNHNAIKIVIQRIKEGRDRLRDKENNNESGRIFGGKPALPGDTRD